MWISDWRLPTLRVEMEEALGPLAVFDFDLAPVAEAPPLPDPAAIAALSAANKLATRARLQVGPNPQLSAAAPEVRHGYGDGLDPARLCPGDLVQPVPLGRWTIRWPSLAPVVVERLGNPPIAGAGERCDEVTYHVAMPARNAANPKSARRVKPCPTAGTIHAG